MSFLRRCLCRSSKEQYQDVQDIKEQDIQVQEQDIQKQEQEELCVKEQLAHVRVKNAFTKKEKKDRRLYTILHRQKQTISSLEYQLKKLKHFVYKKSISEPITDHVLEESSVSDDISSTSSGTCAINSFVEESVSTLPISQLTMPVEESVSTLPMPKLITPVEELSALSMSELTMPVEESVSTLPMSELITPVEELVLTAHVAEITLPVTATPVEENKVEVPVVTNPVVKIDYNCTFIIKSGPNKGNHCKNNRVKGELYCSRHK
jgi:hypothetical protein